MNAPAASLVIRPEKIGDLVVATPAIRALKTAFPDQPVHVLTDNTSADLLRHDPHVDRLITMPWRGPRRGERPAWREIRRLLGGTRYERAAVLYPNCEGWNVLCASLRIPRVAQLGGTWTSLLLGHHRVMRGHYRDPRHYSEYYLDVARKVGAAALTDRLPRLYVHDEEVESLRSRFPGYFAGQPRVVMHPFGLTTRFNLGIEAYKKLGIALAERHHGKVYVIGTPREACQLGEVPAAQIDTSFLQGLGLREVMGVLSQADVVVGGPSGIVHIAAALGVPTIGLYCPSYHHDIVWGPMGPRAETLVVDASACRCLKGGVEVCADRHFCDLSFGIPVARIVERVEIGLARAVQPGVGK